MYELTLLQVFIIVEPCQILDSREMLWIGAGAGAGDRVRMYCIAGMCSPGPLDAEPNLCPISWKEIRTDGSPAPMFLFHCPPHPPLPVFSA